MKRNLLLLSMLLTLYLGVHNGCLALFDTTAQEPVQVLPYSEALYPEADRLLLRQGLAASSPAQLAKILEDYFS